MVTFDFYPFFFFFHQKSERLGLAKLHTFYQFLTFQNFKFIKSQKGRYFGGYKNHNEGLSAAVKEKVISEMIFGSQNADFLIRNQPRSTLVVLNYGSKEP